MRKLVLFVASFVYLLLPLFLPFSVDAQTAGSVHITGPTEAQVNLPFQETVTFTEDGDYTLSITDPSGAVIMPGLDINCTGGTCQNFSTGSGQVTVSPFSGNTITISIPGSVLTAGRQLNTLARTQPGGTPPAPHDVGSFGVTVASSAGLTCDGSLLILPNGAITNHIQFVMTPNPPSTSFPTGLYEARIDGQEAGAHGPVTCNSGTSCSGDIPLTGTFANGTYTFRVFNGNTNSICGTASITLGSSGGSVTGGTALGPTFQEYCNANPTADVCVQVSANGTFCNGNSGVATALGCVPFAPQAFVTALMQFAAGIGGGIALILMIIGSFQVLTSAGNPEQIKKGREQFVAAAIGLVFIILSITILQIIGYDILKIPGFGR